VALVALAPLTLPIPRPLALPLAGGSLIANGRARPDACSSAALATISALSASLSARVRLQAGFSTTTSFPFLFSQPISTTGSDKDAALRARASAMVRAKHRTLGVRGVDARVGFRVRRTCAVWAMWLGLLGLGAERWSCALEAAAARRGGGCARGAAQKARGRHRAAARACEDSVLRQRRLAVAAYSGGEVERRWRERVGCGGGSRREDAGETEQEERRRLEQDSYMTGGPRKFP